ncbi:MAG: PKD domain-containing protein [Armatimonadetes bacterium]|nr:PKD domain-containing protein [Armatimonadota bacterium]
MLKLTSLLALTGVMGVAQAQFLYQAQRDIADQGIKLVGWGGGLVAQSDDVAWEGSRSIRISSQSFFQGGILNFGSAQNLSSPFADKNNLLMVRLNIPVITGGGGGGGRQGGGGLSGTGEGSGGDGGRQNNTVQVEVKPLKTVRMVFTTSDGKKSECYLDISNITKDERGWISAGIPLQAINGFGVTNKMITSIAIGGDTRSTFYVGGMNIENDRTPVYAEPNVRDLNLAYGDEVTFSATGYAGATPVKFMWDFDSRDGITEDATGQVVKRRFRTPGTFTVTLTAVDIYGLKQPYSTTIKVTVNP